MKRINTRNFNETYFEGQHLSLSDLKKERIENGYLFKDNIPPYPKSVKFNVEKVSHFTGEEGLKGIFADSGFKQPSDLVDRDQPHFLWWDLSVTSEDISNAEEQFLKSLFPHQSPAQVHNQGPVLEPFTSSKAFKKESSYGNFRFTFSLKELLQHYGDQFCDRKCPVLRVYETVIYRREIQYTVLVHPSSVDLYDQYPRLPKYGDGVCGYCDGAMWWHCQAPSETYKHKLAVNRSDRSVDVHPHYNEQYYVWDHVCVVFHMEPGWVLHVEQNRLLKRVSLCEVSKPFLLRPSDTPLSLIEAKQKLDDLKASI